MQPDSHTLAFSNDMQAGDTPQSVSIRVGIHAAEANLKLR